MIARIRRAAAAEAEALTALAQAAKRHWGYPESWLDAWREALTITSDYVNANIINCAVDGHDRVIGFYALERNGAGLWLQHLWLEPALIGSGMGRRLFQHAVQVARNVGATELLIEADPNAEGFYLHMGAERVGEAVSRLAEVERVLPRLRYPLPA
jgi:GNAT superfamily N-acetyltransferase